MIGLPLKNNNAPQFILRKYSVVILHFVDHGVKFTKALYVLEGQDLSGHNHSLLPLQRP